jgi:hypothetical protein
MPTVRLSIHVGNALHRRWYGDGRMWVRGDTPPARNPASNTHMRAQNVRTGASSFSPATSISFCFRSRKVSISQGQAVSAPPPVM